MDELKEKITDMIADITGSHKFRDDPEADLIESGILDSLTFIMLIETLEDAFGIEVQPTLAPPDTWRSVDTIVQLVRERLGK